MTIIVHAHRPKVNENTLFNIDVKDIAKVYSDRNRLLS